MSYKRIKGTRDLLPDYLDSWNYVENVFKEIVIDYGFREIRTPVLEHTELFHRTSGEFSDIVSKEMYTFCDKGMRSLSLRPEGTASVVRSYFENKMATSGSIAKLFYVMPMFRYEKPEAGRLRQHHQYGVEWLGERSPYVDASVISLLVYFYGLLGIRGVRVILNSLGCSSCRVRYVEELSSYLEKLSESLCSDCRMRMIKNPLRALDCKNDHCQEVLLGAPKVIDFLCSDCLDDFRSVCRLLELEAVEFEIKPTLVRGLDYYSNTVFEVVADGSLEKEVIAGGGRYDSLMEEIGGVESHAFGFGAGMERLLSLIEKQGIILPMKSKSKVGVVSLCEKANDFVFRFSQILRKEKIACESFFNVRKVGKILSNLSEAGYCGAILVGDNEIEGRTVSVRRFDSRDQISVDFDNLMGVIEFLGI